MEPITSSKYQIKAIIIDHIDAFQSTYLWRIREQTLKVFSKIIKCKSGQLWWMSYQCDTCDYNKIVCFTCKSKLCCSCSTPMTNRFTNWLLSWMSQDINYYHITLTLPEELRNFRFKYRSYGSFQILFDAANKAITQFFRRSV